MRPLDLFFFPLAPPCEALSRVPSPPQPPLFVRIVFRLLARLLPPYILAPAWLTWPFQCGLQSPTTRKKWNETTLPFPSMFFVFPADKEEDFEDPFFPSVQFLDGLLSSPLAPKA